MKVTSLLLFFIALGFSGCATRQSFFTSQTSFGSYHQISTVSQEAKEEPKQIAAKAVSETPKIAFVPAAQPKKLVQQKPLLRNENKLKTAAVFATQTIVFSPTAKPNGFLPAFGQLNQKLQPEPKTRSKTLAAILAAPPLGLAGLHRFYLGYYFIGLLQLGLTAVGIIYGPAPLLIATFCWVITDFIRILKGVLEPNDGHYR